MAGSLSVSIESAFASGVTIAANFSTSLERGAIVVLFGPSGSGKTTVVRAIAGLDRPRRGRIVCGDDVWYDSAESLFVPPQRRRVGCVFQDAALFPHLTARGNTDYGLHDLDSGSRAARAEETLALVELDHRQRRYPHELSGGEVQRAALARAIAPRPRLLLLDEPFAALDTPGRRRIQRLLRSLVDRLGMSAVLVTHDRTEAIALGDAIVVMVDGHVRQVGPVIDVLRRPSSFAVAQSVGVDSVLPAYVDGIGEGLVNLKIGDTRIRAVDANLEGRPRQVFACIRAEDVSLERTIGSGTSQRNHLPARVVGVDVEGPLERVSLDCGFPLAALITRQAGEELALAVGDRVGVAIKATAIHLIPRA